MVCKENKTMSKKNRQEFYLVQVYLGKRDKALSRHFAKIKQEFPDAGNTEIGRNLMLAGINNYPLFRKLMNGSL
jgi:hypothetical protein